MELKSGSRVLLFSDADVFAGTERHMFDLAVGLRREGVEAWIASPDPSILKAQCESAGLRHVAIQKSGVVDRQAVSRLKRLLKAGDVDIIHAHNGRTMLSAAIATTAARRGIAVGTQHFLEPDHTSRIGPKAAAFRMAHRWVSGRLSGYIAISEAVRDTMLARREAPASRIHVVHNGMQPIDEAALQPRAEVRVGCGVREGDSFILCAARLEKEKDISTLIAAVAEVRRTRPAVTCLIAGTGSQENLLKSEIVRLQVESSVRLLGFRTDILSLIGACDLFVLPSLAEPFGLVLLEAMALRKPVIATNAGGPREIVQDGVTGVLVRPSDPAALAEAIQSLLGEPGRLAEMGERGYHRYCEKFTAEMMSKSMIAVYRSLARKGDPSSG